MTDEQAHKKFLETCSKEDLINLILYYELLLSKIHKTNSAARGKYGINTRKINEHEDYLCDIMNESPNTQHVIAEYLGDIASSLYILRVLAENSINTSAAK